MCSLNFMFVLILNVSLIISNNSNLFQFLFRKEKVTVENKI